MATAPTAPHRWRFFRLGGFDQVRLDTPEDLSHLDQLDPKLWSVLSCPTSGLEFDSRTLEIIDADHDGHVRVPEVQAAVAWACAMLRDPGCLLEGGEALPLSAIDDGSPEGAQLLASARQILINLGKAGETAISVADASDKSKIFGASCLNGDGIVCPALADDAEVRAVMEAIIDRFGAETDRSGEPGVSREKCDAFFDQARAYAEWWASARAPDSTVLPLDEDTAEAAEALEAVAGKVDDYFARCRLAAFDARAADSLNPPAEVYASLADQELSASAEAVAALPLARVAAGRDLPLTEGLNPAWTGPVEELRAQVLVPLIGDRDALSAEDWDAIKARFSAYREWLAKMPGERVVSLGHERIDALLAGGAEQAIHDLIEQDKALEAHAESIDAVERLARYHRDLFTLLRNFVSLRDFYAPGQHAIFQAGTLYLDGRSCDLCLRVDDMGRHSALAHFSGTYLAYCECKREGETPMTIVAGMTEGDGDNLMVGRNGVFFDRRGRDWDATVVKLVEHPISIRQAFWTPYKRIARLAQEQIQKFAASHDKVAAAEASGGAAPAPFDIAKFAGIFAAIGLAIGAIGTALAAMVAGLLSLPWWQLPLVILGVMLVVSGPSMLIAGMKLRGRNLAPLLDANGWAVNTRARINLAFGSSLTQIATLPKGSRRSLDDPYADRKRPWKTYLFLGVVMFVLAFLWYEGHLVPWISQLLESLGATAEVG
jgi:hypothetical protein